ncbi:hypothetical protein DN752_01490 [Echinicola strongylocentroti]|uniref:DUF4097 domain-containing protein n=1 Tax=Echinicola strongylocentroti TaxID=1795355 RepID=A0A2Z4IDK9_9BACT|nr:DUF4097 family beta strand repeat-containing protein [Echinicola strongylocentroti]AWW28910.1 hypothetical protein DN752_01490 [Echinicola strongylocentroti]
MKHNIVNAAVALLIGATLLSACSYSTKMSVVSDIEEVFDGITTVEIYGGPLEVTYEGREGVSEVALNAYLESNKPEGVEITYEVDGDRLMVEWEQGDGFSGWGNFKNKGFISVIGPKDVSLKVKGGSGTVSVSDVKHDRIDISAGSGKVTATDLEVADIRLTVSSGKLEGSDLIGNVAAKVSSGMLELRGVDGNVDAVGSSGKIAIADATGKVDAKITSGKIELRNIGELGRLVGSSGMIEAEGAGLSNNTEINFSSGAIRIKTSDDLGDYNFDLKASSGSVRVGDQRSGNSLRINNNASKTVHGAVSSGTIRIVN